jgi:hypothetical protein
MNKYTIIYTDINGILCSLQIEADTEYEAIKEFKLYYVYNSIHSVEKQER